MRLLHPQLLLIRWYSTPAVGSPVYETFLRHLERYLFRAPAPLYVLSDLRFGCIIDETTLKQMAYLATHPNMAAGAAFSLNPTSRIYANRYARMHADASTETAIFDTAHEALDYLENKLHGISMFVDLNELLAVGV